MSKTVKYFDSEVAKEVGTDSAIILSNIEFWQEHNKANNKNNHEGKFWTYNSVSAWNELFEYLSASQIKRCLKKLEAFGYVITGNFNKSSYDRTKWYTSIRRNRSMEQTKSLNRIDDSSQPIPYNKPNINTDNKLNYIPQSQKDFKASQRFELYFTDKNGDIYDSNRNKIKTEKEIKDIEVINPEVVIPKPQKKEKEKSCVKKEKVYDDAVVWCYDDCLAFFPKELHPKDEKEWFEVIDKLNRIDGLEFSDISLIVKAVRNDKFWSKNFLSLTKLRRKDKDKVMYWNVFKEKFKFERSKSESTFDAMQQVLNEIQNE